MTPIADMIEKMTAEGVPMHVIVLAVQTVELTVANGKSGGNPVDKTAEKRRAYDRERQARKRTSGGNPVENPPTTETASSLLKKEKEEAKPKRRCGKSLPDDWLPSADHYVEGTKLGRSKEQTDAKADEMRLWARANGHRAVARKLDWDATFLGWMRRDWGKPNGSAARSGIEGII